MLINKYASIFFKSGLFFGLGMGVVYSFENQNFISSAVAGVIAGILFGLLIAVFSYLADKKLQKKGVLFTESGVNQCRELTLQNPGFDLLKIFKEAISSVKKCKIVKEEGSFITAKTGFSWKSFGEVITISSKSMSDTEVVIKISSRPSLKTTIVDYSKNLENVEDVVGYFKSKYGSQLLESRH